MLRPLVLQHRLQNGTDVANPHFAQCLDRVGSLPVCGVPGSFKKQRNQLRIAPVFQHLDRIGPHARISVAHNTLHKQFDPGRRQLTQNTDRLAPNLWMCMARQPHDRLAQSLGQAKLLRHLQRLEPLLDRARNQSAAQTLRRIRQQL